VGTLLQTGILTVAIMAAIVLRRLAVRTLRGEDEPPFHWNKALQDPRTFKRGGLVLGTLAIGLLFSSLAYFCFEGQRPTFNVKTFPDLMREEEERQFHDKGVAETLKILVPRVFEFIAHVPFASIEFQDISTKPADWSPDQIERVKGADLRGRDLRWVDGTGAFFVKAKLQHADLRHAHLYKANLSGANLDEAELQHARLNSADLSKASLQKANLYCAGLREAHLQEAHLAEACLNESELNSAKLKKTKLQKAVLCGADLSGADLSGADLSGADLSGAELQDIEDWKRIRSIDGANIHDVKNAPVGFVAWAEERGAVRLSPEEWKARKQGDQDSCQELASKQKKCSTK
jgi:uncharacterized protein YjbI with pentapeptide repeats